MTKRSRKQGRERPTAPRPDSGSTRIGSLRRFVLSRWAPPVFFAMLAVVYFSDFVFTGDVIYGFDTGTDFHKGNETFLTELAKVPPNNWQAKLGGMPASAGTRRQYFPAHIISFFTSDYRYFGWRYVLATFCAGYFTFLCIRGFGMRPLTAWVIGFSFASSPAFLSFTYAGHYAKMSAISFFPLMVWALWRGMLRLYWGYFLLLGGTIGVAIYTPHIQIVYFSLWGLGIVFAFAGVQLHRQEDDVGRTIRRTILAAAAVCLGLAIGAEGAFPQWYASTYTKRGVHKAEAEALSFSASWAFHPEEIASLIVPEFVHFDNAGQNAYWGRNAGKWNSDYTGFIILFFGALGLARYRRDRKVILFTVLFLFPLIFSLGTHTPLYRLFYDHVPGVRDIRAVGMIAFLFTFAACGLAAIGLEWVFSDELADERTRRRFLIGAGAGAAVLFLIAAAPEATLGLWTDLFWSDIPAGRDQIARANLDNVSRGAFTALLILSTLSALAWRRLQGRLSSVAFACLLLPIALLDTWRIDRQFLTMVDPTRVPPKSEVNAEAVRFIQKDPGRFRVLPLPDYRQVELPGLNLVTGFHDFTIARYDRILKSGAYNHPRVLGLLNTRYIVTPESLDIPWLTEAAVVANGLHIYRNTLAWPWLYLCTDYVIAEDADRALDRLMGPQFDPTRTAVLEQQPADFIPEPLGEPGSIETLTYDESEGQISVRVQAEGPRLLVISENYHPYWHAFVDGEERPLLRANYLWKAVAVPAGDHRVDLRYDDPVLALSRWITLASTGLFGLGLALWYVSRRRANGVNEEADPVVREQGA